MSDEAVEPGIEGFARTYLLDRVADSLLQAGEPQRISEILAAVPHDGAFTSRLLRAVMDSSERFRPVDRRWMVVAPEVDARRPLDTNLEHLLTGIGRPLTAEQIALLLAEALERPEEALLASVQPVLQSRAKYFPIGDRWGTATWLLDVADHDEEEIIFRNFFDTEEELKRFRERADAAAWDKENVVGSALAFLRQVGEPVPNMVLQFFAWQAMRRMFRPRDFFASLFGKEDALLLSSGHWCSAEQVGEFNTALQIVSDQLAEQASPADEEAEARPETYHVGDAEINEVATLLSDKKSHRISEIIEAIFELSPGERGYTSAFGAIWGAMGAEERFAWVGGERWRLAGTVPRLVHKIPDLLELPYLPFFVNEDGEPADVELEEDGFEGDLLESVKDPRVMIAGQAAPEGTVPEEAPAKVQVPIRYEHRLAGTVPVYGDLRALFPSQPDIIEITLYHGSKSFTGWLSNNTNLTLELGPLFDRLDLPLCGGAFQLAPRGRMPTTDYTVTHSEGETDPLVAVSDERLAQLEAMREDPENVQTSTFELLCKVLEGHKKGAHFVTIFTEINVVRRTHAYLIASLLSAYACFTYLKPGTWGFDEKKVSQGIRKQKRKYIKE